MADVEKKTFDVVSILTGLFAVAYIGGAVYGVVVGALALPLFGYWVRGMQ